ncbi:MAG: hypothetical protein R3F17_09850 [Planctomycetota bacterium]
MRNPKTLLFAAGSVVLAAGVAFAFQDKGRELSDKDLAKVSKAMGEYFQARAENKDSISPLGEIHESIAGLEKKLSKARSQNLLAFPDDLGRALWLSNDYGKKKVKKGKVDELKYTERFYSKENPLNYVVATPGKYNAAEAWPLIIAIPPVDQSPSQHVTEEWGAQELREGAIIAVPKMPAKAEEWMDRPGMAAVMSTLQQVFENYAVDFDRVYLVGTGKGVELALSLAAMRPFAFAGVAGRRGDSGTVGPEAFGNLPVYLTGAGSQAQAFEEKAKGLGMTTVTLNATAEVADIWTWMGEHPRNSYPNSIEFWPTVSLIRSNWLEIERGSASEGAHLKAEIDKGSNTITIEGEGVPAVVLHLSDALVDLDRPVRIVANGASKEAPVRSLTRFLDMAYFASRPRPDLRGQRAGVDLLLPRRGWRKG